LHACIPLAFVAMGFAATSERQGYGNRLGLSLGLSGRAYAIIGPKHRPGQTKLAKDEKGNFIASWADPNLGKEGLGRPFEDAIMAKLPFEGSEGTFGDAPGGKLTKPPKGKTLAKNAKKALARTEMKLALAKGAKARLSKGETEKPCLGRRPAKGLPLGKESGSCPRRRKTRARHNRREIPRHAKAQGRRDYWLGPGRPRWQRQGQGAFCQGWEKGPANETAFGIPRADVPAMAPGWLRDGP
jgi:hypothetical protein